MRKVIPIAVLAISLVGCGLFPKKVEFGQAKVPKFPDKTQKHQELERQTAAKLVQVTHLTEQAAEAAAAPPEVTKPAQEASELASGLSISLGPPSSPWTGPSDLLVARLEAQVAKQNRSLDDLNKRLDKYEGKKIEGTGVVQMPYIVYVGAVLGGFALLFALIHAGVNIGALFNPGVAAAKVGLGLAETVAQKGVAQVVAGGGKFIGKLESLHLETKLENQIKTLFVSAHKEAQDQDIKQLVSTLPGAIKT